LKRETWFETKELLEKQTDDKNIVAVQETLRAVESQLKEIKHKKSEAIARRTDLYDRIYFNTEQN
jgi:hypothetical protein